MSVGLNELFRNQVQGPAHYKTFKRSGPKYCYVGQTTNPMSIAISVLQNTTAAVKASNTEQCGYPDVTNDVYDNLIRELLGFYRQPRRQIFSFT